MSVGPVESSGRRVRPGHLSIEPESLEGRVWVVSVVGDVDMKTAAQLAETLGHGTNAGATAIVVDLTECSFIDTSGLHVLLASTKRLRAAESAMALVVSDHRVPRVLELTGLEAVFTTCGSRAAALASLEESRLVEVRRRVSIRATNEQLEHSCVGLGATGEDRFVFVCECGDRACTSLLHVDLAEYEEVRKHPARFLIARNHENPEVERVVNENGRFAIVETVTGLLSKPALESNPRWQRGEPW